MNKDFQETGIKCDDCNSTNAIETSCPYDKDIHDMITEANLCDSCYYERCMDI